MEIIKFQQGQVIAGKNDKVTYWYLVQEGSVIQKFDFSEIVLPKNSIIGILEKDVFLCDYIAGEDTVLAGFLCADYTDITNIMTGQEKVRNVFLRTAMEQRHQMLCLYAELYNKTKQFHTFVESIYNDYKSFSIQYKVDMQRFSRIDHFNMLEMQHKAESWEIKSSTCIMKKHLQEYLHLMEQDDELTVGVIMEVAAQMRRFTLGIGEMEAYLAYNKGILISESRNDLFALLFDLSIKVYEKKYDIKPIVKDIQMIGKMIERLKIYNPRIVARRFSEFKNYDYAGSQDKDSVASGVRKEIDILSENCPNHILTYAGYDDTEIDRISLMIEDYRKLPDRGSGDKEVHALRRKLTAVYYEIYYKVFIHAMKDESSLTPIIEMFLNFGFIDVAFVGEEHAKALYELSAHVDICHSKHIYTIYEWLKCIYNGEKEPCKNEFDMDYNAHLANLVKTGKLSADQIEDEKENREKIVEFEIMNMFASVNKQTYGKISTFCPILCDTDLLNVEKMLVTADKLESAMNEIRKTDYSVFYREVMFSDQSKGINCEHLMKEILPDIILMPNAGSRGIMWQETSGIKSDTPGRFMFPIFTMSDVDDIMMQVMGTYRWEMCRRLQGVHWNDIRDKSLTAEYCSYIQFYKKNHDLSSDAKEKIKTSLARAKNSYKEVFVRDYANWINFEAKGSFRLNKVTRDILVRYCPFAKSIRNELKDNPVYQSSITKFETETKKKLQRYQAIYDKYVKADGEFHEDMMENLLFYQM